MDEEVIRQNFLEAYEQYSDAIFRHLYFRIYDRELAKDLMQETFEKTWQYLATGKQIENLKNFLYQVSRNLLVSHIRKIKTVSLEGLMEEGFNPSTNVEGEYKVNNEAARLLEDISKLPEGEGELIKMRYLEDMSPQEIAKIIGKSENATSVRLNRAITKLQKLLNFKYGTN